SRVDERGCCLQALPAGLQARGGDKPGNLQDTPPAMGPVVSQQRLSRISSADFGEASGLQHYTADHVSDVRGVELHRHDGVRPVEHLPKVLTVGLLTDHDRPGGEALIVAEADLSLA